MPIIKLPNTGIVVAEQWTVWIGTGKLSWWGPPLFVHTGLDSEEERALRAPPPPDLGIWAGMPDRFGRVGHDAV